MTYDEFSELAFALPEVRENVRRFEIDVFRGERHLARFRVKPDVVAVRLPWDVYDRFAASHPGAFVDFPHYRGTPYLVAPLSKLEPELARALLKEAWEGAFEAT